MTAIQNIAICDYPNALKSAIYGLEEMFEMAGALSSDSPNSYKFNVEIFQDWALEDIDFHIVILPPSSESDYYQKPDPKLIEWLNKQHQSGAILASACAGAFILNQTQAASNRPITTHWGLAEVFKTQFPESSLSTNDLIIDHGDVITAGGMMSWVDLGLELIKKSTSIELMRQLGKTLVIDTAPREQRFYQQFTPSFQHGDPVILSIQQNLHQHFDRSFQVSQLAESNHMTIRTLQRRFTKATGCTPLKYIQKLKVQKACDALENTNNTFERISSDLGYDNVSAFRKIFVNTMGLTPTEFRKRFTGR